jgi:hypothetical protein
MTMIIQIANAVPIIETKLMSLFSRSWKKACLKYSFIMFVLCSKIF